jgi:hypothetical protein
MVIGQMFGPDLFLIASNGGILVFMLSMVRVLYEARYDMQQARDLGHFLNALGDDNVTRTQSGVEKYTQDDTLSSGQQNWTGSGKNMAGSKNDKNGVQSSPTASSDPHRLSPSRIKEQTKLSSTRASSTNISNVEDASIDDDEFRGPMVMSKPIIKGGEDSPGKKIRKGQRPKGKYVVQG